VQGLLLAFGIAIAAPLLYLVATAFKTQGQWVTDPLLLIPKPFTAKNLDTFPQRGRLPSADVQHFGHHGIVNHRYSV